MVKETAADSEKKPSNGVNRNTTDRKIIRLYLYSFGKGLNSSKYYLVLV